MATAAQATGNSSSVSAVPVAIVDRHRVAAPARDQSARIPALDGLRGIAIALVLLHHLLLQLRVQPGPLRFAVIAGRLSWSGVDLFFVLSGFLIGGILLNARESRTYYSTFYVRRAFRILPLYLILLGFCALRYLPFHWLPRSLGSFSAVEIPWIAYFTFTQNFWMAHLGNFGLGTLGPTWSLAIEEQFYLTIPALIRNLSRRRLTRFLLGLVVSIPILRAAISHYFSENYFACHVLMPCRADALAMGVLCAILVSSRRNRERIRMQRKWLYFAAGIGLILLALFTWKEELVTGVWISLRYSVLALFYSASLLLAISRTRGKLHCVLTARILTKLGTISYFTYLFQIPVIEFVRRILNTLVQRPTAPQNVVLTYGLGMTVTLMLGGISWVILEGPLIRRARWFRY